MTPAAYGMILIVFYVLFGILALTMAIVMPESKRNKRVLVVVVLILLFAFPAYKKAEEFERRAHANQAKEYFLNLCKEVKQQRALKIEASEGIVWMKWRSRFLGEDQYTEDEPWGHDCGDENCIYQLLRGNDQHGVDDAGIVGKKAYKFVEARDPVDQKIYRYEGSFENFNEIEEKRRLDIIRRQRVGAEANGQIFVLKRTPQDAFTLRYGLSWENIADRKARSMWIAGGALQIVELSTGRVIAEHQGYLRDRGLGSVDGGRQPWKWARSSPDLCPVPKTSTWDFAFESVPSAR